MVKPYHNPPHLYLNKTIYFLTSRTINGNPYFGQHLKKKLLKTILKEAKNKFGIEIYAWVVLENHYHLLFKINKGKDLAPFIKIINGKSAFELNRMENKKGRKIWFNYFDTCIRDEKTFWTRLNYIHQNPVKHGVAKRLEDYLFSSYNYYLKTKGKEWHSSLFQTYPVIDFLKEDQF